MPYLYCMVVTVASTIACAFLGYCILKGASVWMVVPMCLLAYLIVVPGHNIFTCPKCGHTADVKAFTIKGQVQCVQKKEEQEVYAE